MNTILSGFFAVLFFTSTLPQAIEVNDLYEASVTIPNQSRQARLTAQKDALRKVLVKVSGSYSVLDNAEVKRAVRQAGQYLRQFQYTRDDENQLLMLASFDEAKINKLLRTEALPIWGKRRPSILLWMAGEDPKTGVRQVVSKESYPEIAAKISQLSQDRGLPIVIPLYDIVDNKKVLVSDVWGYFYNHIRTFSLRYNTDAIVISRFKQLPQENNEVEDIPMQAPIEESPWQLQWRLFETDNNVDSNMNEGELNRTIEQLVSQLADRYASRYAVDSSKVESGNRLILTVTNVGDIESLINAEKLLLSFSAVSDVLLKTVKQDKAEFEVILLGESLDLLQGLELEKRFEKIFDPLAENPQDQPLAFRWMP